MDGNRSTVELGVHPSALRQVFRDPSLVGDADEFCAFPAAAGESELESHSLQRRTYCLLRFTLWRCLPLRAVSASHGKRAPAALRRYLAPFRSDERRSRHPPERSDHAVPVLDVGSCTRCPGLAYMEGNMRGPSTQDCEKSFARTGVPSANMIAKQSAGLSLTAANMGHKNLVQIRAPPASVGNASASASA